VHTTDVKRRKARSQVYLAIAIAVLALMMLGLYAYMRQVAAARAAAHKHSFYEYVVTHHIGQLTDIDTGTGIEPMSYVLTLGHPLPVDQRLSFAVEMARLYALYDHGQSLTIVFADPATKRQQTLAETQYDAQARQLTVLWADDQGSMHTVKQPVNW
jgi:DNA-binding transcriptional regulator YbjK